MQEHSKFKATLGCKMRHCLKNKTNRYRECRLKDIKDMLLSCCPQRHVDINYILRSKNCDM